MMRYGGGYGMAGFGFGWIMMIFLFALMILGIFALIRYLKISYPTTNRIFEGNKALEILNERYAKSEISDEEYKTKKAELIKTKYS